MSYADLSDEDRIAVQEANQRTLVRVATQMGWLPSTNEPRQLATRLVAESEDGTIAALFEPLT